ncbi:MAG: IS1595 family transposase [Mariniphaga sp.]|nr:IS1595 family transposase [Mariniphaga sp.]
MFKGENIIEFQKKFHNDDACQTYLADIKLSNGYKCLKCGYEKFSIRTKGYARECHLCHHVESPTANTMFHKVKFGLQKAFMIAFEMSATTKGLSASQVAKRYSITRKTAWYFMQKVRLAMESSNNFPIENIVQVDEFVFGGRESLKQGRSNDSRKKKLIAAVEISDTGKVKRAYFQKIEDYSAESLRQIFDTHISKKAIVYTDKWTGYKPIGKDYNITQKYSDKGNSMKQIHTIIHQVKSWIRSVYSWVDEGHIEKYLAEFSFRINRSIYKQTIFHKLIERMVVHKVVEFKLIKLAVK